MMRPARTRRFFAALVAGLLLAALTVAAPAASVANAPEPGASVVKPGDVDLVFLAVADRYPEKGERDDWLRQTADGESLETLVAVLANLSDFDTVLDAPTNEAFIEALYPWVLERPADSAGLSYWVTQLASGTSRESIVVTFALSTEFVALIDRVFPDGEPVPGPLPDDPTPDGTNPQGPGPISGPDGPVDFELNILHINDHHSHLQADDIGLPLGGLDEVTVDVGGFGRVATLVKELDAELPNSVKVHAGDAITGTLFFSLFKGEADAAAMNETCFDVFGVGNHEFDESDQGLDDFLDQLNDGDCETAVLGANVVPAIGTPLAPFTPTDYLEPFVVKEYGGERVGFVGLVIAQKTKVSSSPLDTTEFLDEVATAQRYVDQLTADGVDNIVLVTHIQYRNDIALAAQVSGVDVIIGGDSHTLLGDGFTDYGFEPDGPYPTHAADADGNPVCIATAWKYALVVGELNVGFDENGVVTSCSGTPHLLLGDNFTKEVPDTSEGAEEGDTVDQPIEGAELDAVLAEIGSTPFLDVVAPDPATEELIASFAEQVDLLSMAQIGTATEDLCLARVPNDTRTAIPTCAGNTPNGGDIQQLVTEAFLARAFRAEIALQNSGGIRVDIPAGPVTVADAYTLLPFANTMVEMDLTGAEIKATLEEGIINWLDNGGSSGAYPYAAGLRFDVDLTQPAGQRFSNLEYNARGSDEWVPLDDSATYIVVTNSFMASGGDGYTTMGDKFAAGEFVDTFLDYAQTFIDFVEQDAGGVISKPAPERYSTQNFVPAP